MLLEPLLFAGQLTFCSCLSSVAKRTFFLYLFLFILIWWLLSQWPPYLWLATWISIFIWKQERVNTNKKWKRHTIHRTNIDSRRERMKESGIDSIVCIWTEWRSEDKNFSIHIGRVHLEWMMVVCVCLCASGFCKARLYVNLRLMNTLIASAVLYGYIWPALYVHRGGKFKVKTQREIHINWQPKRRKKTFGTISIYSILVEHQCWVNISYLLKIFR